MCNRIYNIPIYFSLIIPSEDFMSLRLTVKAMIVAIAIFMMSPAIKGVTHTERAYPKPFDEL